MFSKAFRVKSHSQLKASERKKIRLDILKNFPSLSEEELKCLLPNKEVVLALKIETHSGEHVMVYCVDKQPMLLDVQQVMYPTVYMLWMFPDLMPTFSTWPQVIPKLVSGAGLMLPGVVLPDGPVSIRSYGDLKKGDRVAINMTTNRAAFGIGQATLSSEDMYMSARKGKAVNILHHVGDQLWSYGTKCAMPQLGRPYMLGEESSSDETKELTPDLPTEVEDLTQIVEGTKSLAVCAERLLVGEDLTDDDPEYSKPVDTEQVMDSTIQYCFLKSLKVLLAKKVELPLLTSTFFKLYMIPACPPDLSLDLKKSSYKKLSKFLSFMTTEGLVLVKEQTKGVDCLTSINADHDQLRYFKDTFASTANQSAVDDSKPNGPKITEVYAVTAAVLPILHLYNIRKGTKLLAPEIRKHLTQYVKEKNLQCTDDKSKITLDAVLCDICSLDKQQVHVVTWEYLMATFIGCMTRSSQIEQFLGASSKGESKAKVEPIDMQVAKRSGNKKVTLVYNLELFGIDLVEFARTCQVGVAASTSISNVTHRKGPQLLIQGNQVHFVGKLLQDQYEIPKKYIRGLEKAVKPKKSN